MDLALSPTRRTLIAVGPNHTPLKLSPPSSRRVMGACRVLVLEHSPAAGSVCSQGDGNEPAHSFVRCSWTQTPPHTRERASWMKTSIDRQGLPTLSHWHFIVWQLASVFLRCPAACAANLFLGVNNWSTQAFLAEASYSAGFSALQAGAPMHSAERPCFTSKQRWDAASHISLGRQQKEFTVALRMPVMQFKPTKSCIFSNKQKSHQTGHKNTFWPLPRANQKFK